MIWLLVSVVGLVVVVVIARAGRRIFIDTQDPAERMQSDLRDAPPGDVQRGRKPEHGGLLDASKRKDEDDKPPR